jgi:hypothetical protein
MRCIALVGCAVLLVGCGGAQDQTEMPADSAAETVMPAGISLADVAGTWTVRAMAENSDSVLITYQLVATGETTGWTMTLPNTTEPIPVHIMSVAGDSIVAHAGPYPSALRPGVTVTTEGVFRLQNGMLVGRTIARYSGGTPDSVLVVRTEGQRAQ